LGFFEGGEREATLQQRLIGRQVRQPREEVADGDCPEGVSHQRVRVKTKKKLIKFLFFYFLLT